MYSDLYTPRVDYLVTDKSSSLSDVGGFEDVFMLASTHPKKRTGRKKFKETRHPVYRGVRMRNSNKWVCEVREPNKRNRIWLGTYPTAEMAARAHDVASLALRGIKGCLNFADSAWRLPKPASNDPEDIQRAAAEAAALFSCDEENAEISTIDEDSTNYEVYEECQKSRFCYMEDESIFDMPGLLNDMAEGLLQLPPEYLNGGYRWDMEIKENESDMSLWNYSM